MVANQFRDLGLSAATVQKKDITHEGSLKFVLAECCGAGLLITMVVCALSPLISIYYKESRLTIITCILANKFCVWRSDGAARRRSLTRQLKLGKTVHDPVGEQFSEHIAGDHSGIQRLWFFGR